jgi:pimeloyl-ACP methyl ester carboxylesterase
MTTFLLVHGAWHGAWCWDELAPKLGDTRTVELPSKSPEHGDLFADAAVVADAIAAIDGHVTVVAHSYGGAVATEGAHAADHIVYLAAFMLDVGESLLGTVGGVAPDWWQFSEDGALIMPLRPEEIFYNDCPPEATAAAVARLQQQTHKSFTDQITRTAWRETRASYVICDRDNAIPPFAQEAMSARAGRVERLDASHSPFVSRPDELAKIILSI